MSKTWADEMTARTASEVKRLRGGRSGQWLADRTRELGYPISRTTISELENGKRGHVTVAELLVLAAALDTAPALLMYPAPFGEPVDVLPDVVPLPPTSAIGWLAAIPGAPDDGDLFWCDIDHEAYAENVEPLQQARRQSAVAQAWGAALRPSFRNAQPTDDDITLMIDSATGILDAVRRYLAAKGETDGG